ncbi:MAG: FG-GAP-like repeat-containing protein [candidate division WOR-3 bacterium]
MTIRILPFLIFSINFGVAQIAQIAILDGHETGGKFGYAVASRIDFNADGLADVVVGEPGWNKVYLYFGNTSFDTTPDLIFVGTPGTQFGSCLAVLGDINGDGIDDLAIGAPRDNSGGSNAGRVYVYFGSEDPDTTADFILTGHINSGRFGTNIGGGFDINRDEGMDILIGAPADCKAYLFLGGTGLDTIPDLILHDGNGDYYGQAVALLGDVNGDTFGEMLVGDYRHTGSILHDGGCFLYFGGNPPDPNVDIIWEGDEQNRQLGISVAALGDLNGDGLNDIGLGASMTNKVHIHFGSNNIGQPPDIVLQGHDWFGCWIAGQGNINGDEYDDLIVGADGDEYGIPYGPGYAFLFLGGNPMSPIPDTILVGETEGDMFGSCASFCGDINNDQHIEFCIGAPGNDARGLNAGRVYIYSSFNTNLNESGKSDITKSSNFRLRQGNAIRAKQSLPFEYELPQSDKAQILVLNAIGQIVFQQEIHSSVGTITVPVLPAGVYNLIIRYQKESKSKRLIIIE